MAEKHWSQIQESGTILGIRILLCSYSVLGRRGFRFFLLPVIFYYYLTNRTARTASADYLRTVSPYLSPQQQTSLSSLSHFMQFADMILDKLLVWMGKLNSENVLFKTLDTIQHVRTSGKGGLLVVSHLGNIEVCNALRQQVSEVRITILVNTQHAQKFNALIKKFSGHSQAELLQVNDISPATAMLLSERIEAGELIVIAGDRTPQHAVRTSEVEFFGRQAALPQGAFILASLLKCPVYLLFCLKQQDKYHVYLELFAEQLIFSRQQRKQALDQVVQTYARRLQHYCLKAPMQWFNFYPFWHDNDIRVASAIDKKYEQN